MRKIVYLLKSGPCQNLNSLLLMLKPKVRKKCTFSKLSLIVVGMWIKLNFFEQLVFLTNLAFYALNVFNNAQAF